MRFSAALSTIIFVFSACVLPACAAEESKTDDPAGSEGKTVRTASGLEITELKAGDGDHPTRQSVVAVHYHGTFEDGKVFDSSVDRNQPAPFGLNRVIKCWTEGLQKMKVGGKAKLVCPADIAYGAAGRPPKIPANATLYFEVELLAIE